MNNRQLHFVWHGWETDAFWVQSYKQVGRENPESHGAAVLCFGGINLGGGRGPKGEGWWSSPVGYARLSDTEGQAEAKADTPAEERF